jgi:ATP-dependent RNA helicase SUPV3L1/SUV3
MSGYRAAGARAIRIDMLERLADMLRSEDSRGGFEAKADMLSITGMTLEQFADLMQGLGYKPVRGERDKVRAVAEETTPAAEAPPAEAPTQGGDEAIEEAPEKEVFYTFTWAGAGRREKPAQERKPKPRGKPKGKPGARPDKGAKTFTAKPKKEKPIDPDNPFAAALMGLKDKT